MDVKLSLGKIIADTVFPNLAKALLLGKAGRFW
jgi:hypothetical protein